MSAPKDGKTVKYPAKAIPMARLEKWKKANAEVEELAKQIQEAQTALVGKRAVAEFLAKELAEEFGVDRDDKVNLETGEITRAKKPA